MRFGMGLTGLRDGRDLNVEMANTVRTQYNMFSHALAFFRISLSEARKHRLVLPATYGNSGPDMTRPLAG